VELPLIFKLPFKFSWPSLIIRVSLLPRIRSPVCIVLFWFWLLTICILEAIDASSSYCVLQPLTGLMDCAENTARTRVGNIKVSSKAVLFLILILPHSSDYTITI
jgi:hypothetical protein